MSICDKCQKEHSGMGNHCSKCYTELKNKFILVQVCMKCASQELTGRDVTPETREAVVDNYIAIAMKNIIL